MNGHSNTTAFINFEATPVPLAPINDGGLRSVAGCGQSAVGGFLNRTEEGD